MNGQFQHLRVLSVFPTRTGFAYALLEGGVRLVDWGTMTLGVRSDAEYCARLEELVRQYSPWMVAVEDYSNTRRGQMARARIEVTLECAQFNDVHTTSISPGEARQVLGLPLRASKHHVALRLIELFPELSRKSPRRAIWHRDARMDVFESVALSVAATNTNGNLP